MPYLKRAKDLISAETDLGRIGATEVAVAGVCALIGIADAVCAVGEKLNDIHMEIKRSRGQNG